MEFNNSPYFESENILPVYAKFGERLLAFLIDILLLNTISGILLFSIGGDNWIEYSSDLKIQIFGGVLNWLYFSLFESSERQATIGKSAMGIKVQALEGGRLSWGRATGRHFGKIISALALGMGFIWILFSPRNQAWHDSLVDAVLVKS